MRKKLRLFWLTILLFPAFSNIHSQATDRPIELKTLSVDIKASLFTATTTIQMEFFNPNNKILDGEYNFSLGPGQVITGFALDINGFMREGVIVDKQKGRVAYENTIRRRIDPGLLEMTAGDNYRVRVYPMPVMGTRKIKIVIDQRMPVKDNALQYYLPLDIPYKVRQLNINIAVGSQAQTPLTGDGFLKPLSFIFVHDSAVLKYDKQNTEVKLPLAFSIPLPSGDRIVCVNKTDSLTQFALHIKPGLSSVPAKFASATVFWDISASAAKRDNKKDIQFLESFIIGKNITDLTIVTFSNEIHNTRAWHGRSMINMVRRFLQSQVYDGGTQLGSLDCSKFNSDIFLLFTDGINNFGNSNMKLAQKPVHCINSAPSANHTMLRTIAAKTGGRYINLYMTDINKAIAEFNTVQKALVKVQTGNQSLLLCHPIMFDEWVSYAGEIKNTTDPVILSFSDNGRVVKTETIRLDNENTCSTGEAAKSQMLLEYEQLAGENDNERLFPFAKYHKIVSASTSFIVLDNINDYIQYGIEPPSDLREQYNQMQYVVKDHETQQKTAAENEIITNLRNSVDLYNQRINWWGKAEPISLQAVEQKNNERLAATIVTNEQEAPVAEGDGFFKMSSTLNEVVVVGYGTQRRSDVTGAVTSINQSQMTGAATVFEMLEGRVAGVNVMGNAGSPGMGQKIFIRGAGSLGNGHEPLYILDGVVVDADFVATLGTGGIESIEVVKDNTASVLYGSRAANGAIIITTKRVFRNSTAYKNGIEKYKDMEDVEYVTELKDIDKNKMYGRYIELRDSLGKNPAFYFDVAELMFESGDRQKALLILSNLAEMENENHQLLRAMGYQLENWGMYDEAIEVYAKVLDIKEEEPQSYRDLALAYEKKGDHQRAVDLLYQSLTKNWWQYETRYRGLKSLILNEMNAIIAQNGGKLDITPINSAIIRPLPADLRIVIDWNKDATDIDLHIVEPGGETCYYSNRFTKSGGRLSEDFTQGYGPEEYEIKQAKEGKYKIQVNYYGDRYQKQQIPSFIKLTIYKNFGRPGQSMTVKNIIMDNQTGMIEIGEIKY